jgi:hypothetical protein
VAEKLAVKDEEVHLSLSGTDSLIKTFNTIIDPNNNSMGKFKHKIKSSEKSFFSRLQLGKVPQVPETIL